MDTILKMAIWLMLGYFSGGVLYALVFAKLLKKDDLIQMSVDNNPGTANAFRYGGFWCGVLTLICDVLKGFLPVFLYMTYTKSETGGWLFSSLMIASPVIGHAFPVIYRFQGGKGIAVSFGCLLGLLPTWQPLAALAMFFILFSVVLRITPHYHRTLAAYICSLVSIIITIDRAEILIGYFIIASVVIIKLILSKEDKERMGVKLLWMH